MKTCNKNLNITKFGSVFKLNMLLAILDNLAWFKSDLTLVKSNFVWVKSDVAWVRSTYNAYNTQNISNFKFPTITY